MGRFILIFAATDQNAAKLHRQAGPRGPFIVIDKVDDDHLAFILISNQKSLSACFFSFVLLVMACCEKSVVG